MKKFIAKVKSLSKIKLLVICLSLILFVALGVGGWGYRKYYNKKMEKNKISAVVRTPYEFYDESYIPSVNVRFSGAAVATDDVGKNVNNAVRIEPKIRGEFKFTTTRDLEFKPLERWKPGTKYTMIFDKKFGNFKQLSSNKYSFETDKNEASISDFELYENPNNIAEKKVVATIEFDYPVELADVKKNVSLVSENADKLFSGDKKLDYTLRMSDDKLELYVDSALIKIAAKEDYIVLKYTDGSKTLTDRVRIPSSSDYFKFTDVETTTVFNSDRQQEEQIVLLKFTRPVKVSDVLNNLEMFKSSSDGGCYYQNNKKAQELLKNGTKMKYENLSGNEKYSRIITLKIDEVKPDNFCLLTFLKGELVSEDGFVMNDTTIRVNKIPNFTKEVKVIADGAILNANGNKHLTFVSRGYDRLFVEINRLNDDAINHLITQTYGDFKSAYFENSYSFNEDNIAEKFEKIINVNNMNPSKPNYASMDLDKYLKGKRGIFIIKTFGLNGDDVSKSYSPDDRRMIIITDIGIMVKTNLDNAKNIFISSLESGKPIANAKVEVIGKNGLPVASGKTNDYGYVLFPSLEHYKMEKQPVAYVVHNGKDISFIPFYRSDRNINYSGFDVGGLYASSNETENANIKSLIFTDRGLYRPGENVEMGFIVKNEYLGNFSNNLPLLVTIDNPQGNEVYRKLVNGNGLFDLSFATKSDAPTGLYTIYLHVLEKKNEEYRFLSSKNFKVEEFQPDRMKISVNFDNTKGLGWFSDSSLKGKITLENLFGAPAQNRIVKSSITITPKKFNFSKYKGYSFTDLWKDDIYKTQEIIEELPESETNNDGTVDFDLDLSKYKSGSYTLQFVAEGFEPDGGRSVVAVKNMLISPLKYIIGYKTNSSLRYIKKDSQQKINLIAIDQKLEKIAANGLKAKIQQINYESILTQESSGRLRYQKEKVYKDIAVKNINISKSGLDFTLPTNVVGEIQITIVDDKENELAMVNYNVVGESNISLSKERNAELNLVLNKSEYNSGDTIEMAITSPYSGYGLITIERDKVYAYKWFRTNTTSSVQTIKLPNNVDGNAYINVAFMRDLKSKEVFISPLSYAVAPFNINRSKFKVDIELTAPELAKPGDTIEIGYSLNKKSDIIIYGVDEGILQVANYRLPDPLYEFTKKLALQVKTSQIFDLVLPSFEIIKQITGIGGGEGFNEINNAINPFARKVDKPVAFWSGVLKDKTSGTYSYKIPDYFNGRIRIMAVAVADAAVGSTQEFLNSRADIVIIPNFPVSISPNDKIDITVGIGNYIENSGKDTDIEITAQTSSNLKITTDKAIKINVPENQERTASFSIEALNSLGNAEITFTAKCLGDTCKTADTTTIKSTASLRPSSPYEVIIESGKGTKKTFENLIDFFREYNVNQLVASPSPLLLTQGLFDFLEEFPYGCTEQITSKIFPLLVVKSKYPELITSKNFEKLLANTVAELTERQNSDGGFSAWPLSNSYDYHETNQFHTLYAMHFLTTAKLNGYYVPNTVFNSGIQWIEDFVSHDPRDLNDLRNKSYGLYILTLNDILPTANLVSLEKIIDGQYKDIWTNDISGLYIASAYRLMQEDKMANKIIDKFKLQNNKKYYNSYDSNDLRNVQYIYLTGLYFPNKFNKIKDEAANVLLDIVQNNRYNTLLSSYSIMALTNYSNTIDDNSITFTLKDKNKKQLELKVKNTPFTTLEIPNSNIKEVGFSSKEPVYYSLIQKGFQKNPSQKAFSKNIEISKRLLNLDGKEIKSIEQGNELIIQLRIQNLTKDYMDNLAVVDLLPTGFEIINIVKMGTIFSTNLREDRFVGYLNLSNEMVEIEYKVKATTKGTITVPPAYIEDLYNVENSGQSAGSKFVVK